MEKIQLGNSELFVSFIGLGTMNFGAVNTEDESHKILDYYFKIANSLEMKIFIT